MGGFKPCSYVTQKISFAKRFFLSLRNLKKLSAYNKKFSASIKEKQNRKRSAYEFFYAKCKQGFTPHCQQIVCCVTALFGTKLLCQYNVLQSLQLCIPRQLFKRKVFSWKFLLDLAVIFSKAVRVNCIAEYCS